MGNDKVFRPEVLKVEILLYIYYSITNEKRVSMVTWNKGEARVTKVQI
jgi:hypothetical protein